MKYVNQLEYPDWLYVTKVKLEGELAEKGRTTTIKGSGCGLCSAVMVANRLLPDCDFELKDAIRLSYESEANHATGTDYNRFAPAFAEKCGLDMESSNDPERLRYCLRTGGAAVLHVKGDRDGRVGVFSHVGHYVAAISVAKNSKTFHPRLKASFPRVLGRYVRERKVISLHEAIRKCTAMPASVYGLPTKGILKEGFDADICIFDAKRIIDKADYINCHERCEGLNYVILNGEVVVENAVYNGKKKGGFIARRSN